MEDIKAWFDSTRDIEVGRSLYNKYAPRYNANSEASHQINTYSNSFTRELLIEELTIILEKAPTTRNIDTVQSAKYHTAGELGDLPEDLVKLDREIPILYKRRDFMRYAMRKVEPGEKLKEMALEVVDLDLQIRKHYKILDFWKRTGNYPPDFHNSEDYTDNERAKFVFWMNAMRSYPSWISRNKNNPEKAKELEVKQQVMADIDKFLKDANNEERPSNT